jgi:hypothetical protein
VFVTDASPKGSAASRYGQRRRIVDAVSVARKYGGIPANTKVQPHYCGRGPSPNAKFAGSFSPIMIILRESR